jgi:hypothetical protein
MRCFRIALLSIFISIGHPIPSFYSFFGIKKFQYGWHGLFTNQDPPPHPSIKGCEDVAYEAVYEYCE